MPERSAAMGPVHKEGQRAASLCMSPSIRCLLLHVQNGDGGAVWRLHACTGVYAPMQEQ